MILDAFRITKTSFVPTAFNGEGARLYGGRWNSVGTRMIYLAGSLSGATLELLVHTDDYETIEGLYSYIPVTIPNGVIAVQELGELPNGWDSPAPISATQQIGDQWIKSMSSAVLQVPSVITAGESNFLVNPEHDDFAKLGIGDPQSFKLDPRI